MARAGDQRHQGWTLHRDFEPTRLRAAPLAEAYEAVLPVLHRRPGSGTATASQESTHGHGCHDQQRAS